MKNFLSKAELSSWLRTLLTVLILAQLIEWWQARDLRRGELGFSLLNLPILDSGSLARSGENQYTLLYAFAPWCGVCRLSADNLNRLQELNIRVIALALSWNDVEQVRKFVLETDLKVPVLLADDSIAEQLGLSAFPSQYLLSPSGQSIKAWSGYTTTFGFYWKVFWGRLTGI